MDAKRKLIGFTALGAALAAMVFRACKRGGKATAVGPGHAAGREDVNGHPREPKAQLEEVR